MNNTIYRAGDKLCPYCMDDGPFVKKGHSVTHVKLIDGEEQMGYIDRDRTYLECLVCGNTFIKHAKPKRIPVQVQLLKILRGIT